MKSTKMQMHETTIFYTDKATKKNLEFKKRFQQCTSHSFSNLLLSKRD